MTSTQIRYFLAVAKYLNFSEAARSLFVAQSSLSRNISSLEAELGVQLFLRTKKYVRLTPAGAVWLEEFKKFQELFETAKAKAKGAQLGKNASIRIGMIEAQESENFLPEAIDYLKKNYPEISIQLTRGNFKDLRQMLRSNEIDVALTLSFDVDSYKDQNVVCENFYESNGECVISKYHPLANAKTICFEDLKDDPMIIISPEISQGGYEALINLCREHNFTPKKIQTATSVEQIMLYVESGLGFSMLDENCKLHNNHSVRFIRFKEDDILRLVGVWHKDNLNPAIPLFINYLIQNAKVPLKHSNN